MAQDVNRIPKEAKLQKKKMERQRERERPYHYQIVFTYSKAVCVLTLPTEAVVDSAGIAVCQCWHWFTSCFNTFLRHYVTKAVYQSCIIKVKMMVFMSILILSLLLSNTQRQQRVQSAGILCIQNLSGKYVRLFVFGDRVLCELSSSTSGKEHQSIKRLNTAAKQSKLRKPKEKEKTKILYYDARITFKRHIFRQYTSIYRYKMAKHSMFSLIYDLS